MEIQDFVAWEYILSFPGMTVVVAVLTQMTKKLFDKIGTIHTKWLVYGFSVLLCAVAAMFYGTWGTVQDSVQTSLSWFVNSAFIWFAARKLYETFLER